MDDKMKVLFLASDPFENGAPLQLDEEVRAVRRAIERGSARDALELIPLFALRVRDLQEALLRHQPQVVHFAGHGGAAGVVLGDEHGQPRTVGKEALGKLFGLMNGSIKAVVLNGCDTLGTVEAMSGAVDYTIGMNRPITDTSAIVFAEAFYVALAMGQPVRTSFDLAVIQLEMEGSEGSDTPVLRVRPGVDSTLALVSPRAPAAAAPPPPAPERGSAGQRRRMMNDIRLSPNDAPFGGGDDLDDGAMVNRIGLTR